jgi:hypothetical protein
MKKLNAKFLLLGTLAFITLGLGGCSSGYAPGYSSSGSSSVYMGYSHGMGYYDPWYRHGYYRPPVIVNPPSRPHPDRPVNLPSHTRPAPAPSRMR